MDKESVKLSKNLLRMKVVPDAELKSDNNRCPSAFMQRGLDAETKSSWRRTRGGSSVTSTGTWTCPSSRPTSECHALQRVRHDENAQ
ncbi:hypothetical protein INR49_009470 [Caranx melampygus]|nr:hypothetical protein INR49_009470 [Caranx melampygus]